MSRRATVSAPSQSSDVLRQVVVRPIDLHLASLPSTLVLPHPRKKSSLPLSSADLVPEISDVPEQVGVRLLLACASIHDGDRLGRALRCLERASKEGDRREGGHVAVCVDMECEQWCLLMWWFGLGVKEGRWAGPKDGG